MYVLLNRENIVVDILSDIRYIKLQSSNGIVVACEEDESTGVIGSDCDTHYTLIKSDTLNSPNAVRIMECEEILSNVTPNLYKYNTETQSFEYRYTLDEAKELKQTENKALFAAYLETHPLTWVDGKEYGITMEDQSEIQLNLSQYNVAIEAGIRAATLEWHARHEECTAWTAENLIALSLDIADAVYPMYRLCQTYKIAIYGAETIEELNAVELIYEQDESDME